MNRMQTDEFVWLHGGRVERRKAMGKSELVISNCPLLVDESFAKFDITLRSQGIEQHMRAVKVNNSIVCWEA